MSGKLRQGIQGLLALLLVAAVLLAAAPAGAAETFGNTHWTASYWNGTEPAGNPVVVRDEAEINYNWGNGSPVDGINADNFFVRWERTITAYSTGKYEFTATADDGMRVWVDGVLIIDAWNNVNSVKVTEVHRVLNKGQHQVRVEYVEKAGAAVAKLNMHAIISEWRGEYFANKTLSGEPAMVRNDPQITFTWGKGSPEKDVIPADGFSVRWTRSLGFPAGRYRFGVSADDGVRLWVNGKLVIDKWYDHTTQDYEVEVDLPGGQIPLRMEYYENVGDADVSLGWMRVAAPPPAPVPPPAGSTWHGEYYNNTALVGSPAFARDDAQINFNWGNGAPAGGVSADNFSVRWSRNLALEAGRYRFTATVDDGIRLWVNNQLIIDQWQQGAARTLVAEITVPAGSIPVRLEYFEQTGQAQVALSWAKLDGTQSEATATVKAYKLNVRSGPSPSNTILTVTTKGTVLQMVGRNAAGSWVRVILPNGTQGWVSATYIQTAYPVMSLPVVN